jgi:hypothetical protein
LLEGATGVFGGEAKAESATSAVDLKTLHAKIGELTLENAFFRRCAHQGGTTERKPGSPSRGRCVMGWKAMIDPDHDLSIQKQAVVLEISRSTVYYTGRARFQPRICGRCGASTNCISTRVAGRTAESWSA